MTNTVLFAPKFEELLPATRLKLKESFESILSRRITVEKTEELYLLSSLIYKNHIRNKRNRILQNANL